MLTKVKTLGVILDHLSVSQLNLGFLSGLNKLSDTTNDNVCVFNKNISPPLFDLKFGVFGLNLMHDVEDGVVIATDLDSASILIHSQTTARKIFYVWDLEWLHNPTKKNFLENVEIYRNIELFTRSQSYALAIQNYCNVLPRVYTIEELLNVI